MGPRPCRTEDEAGKDERTAYAFQGEGSPPTPFVWRSFIDDVDRLRSVVNRFGEPWRSRKAALLRGCGSMALDALDVLLRYHDCLLFLLAYPEDRGLHAAAALELERVAAAARALALRPRRSRRSPLFDTGVAWSETTHAYSYLVARWLARTYADYAEIEGGDEDETQRLKSVLRLALPPMEYELVGEESQTVEAFFELVRGTGPGSNLAWLVKEFETLPCSEEVREHLYDALELFLKLSPRDGPLSRTFARGLPVRTFMHRGLERAFDLQHLVDTPFPPARRVSRADEHLLGAARGILAMLGRETDVITLATSAGIESFDLERGVSIALYAMPPRRRFPLDTHVGFMLFKNRIPVAYGGGWPFLGTCKVGINVFEPFRGGESAYLFGQVLRVYERRFAAERFLVEPYQIGAGNREGIRSGAFWFYYRLGFRPIARRHAALAHAEFMRIGTESGYRSPLAVLRRLSRADLELRVSATAAPHEAWPEPGLLSAAVSHAIARDFAGDRAAALEAAQARVAAALRIRSLARWTDDERHAFTSLSLVLALIPDLATWSPKDRLGCVAIIRAKGAQDEAEYARRTAAHKTLRAALRHIVTAYQAE